VNLYNTLSKTKEEFTPIDANKVLMYSCGPTVYDYAHIGNMRTYLSVDFLRRTLEYLGHEVVQVKNITDVGHLTQDDIDEGEDKISLRAQIENLAPKEIAECYEKAFKEDESKLNIEPANTYPRATEYVQKMIEAIETLIEKDFAYEVDGAVFFDITKAKEYGKLSGNTLQKLQAGSRITPDSKKKNPFDFYLWRPAEIDHLMKWPSPWSEGYPGWHIECSVMSKDCLQSDIIDIHTGGEDNIFPHHENEIAQSRALSGAENPVRFWFHPRHLVVEGEKMSKSKNNFYTLKDLEKLEYNPLAFRLLVFSAHYRSPIDFSFTALDQSSKNLETIKEFLRRLSSVKNPFGASFSLDLHIKEFRTALTDDLDTPRAIAVIFVIMKSVNKLIDENQLGTKDAKRITTLITEFDKVLGLNLNANEVIPKEIIDLAEKRLVLKKENKYNEADAVRKEIKGKGFEISDTSSETTKDLTYVIRKNKNLQ
jgi:cysteinyl-tRNA synthetase